MNVLVLGDDTRSFLAVVRSFGRRGFGVDVCPFDFSSPALASVYIRSVFHLPNYYFGAEQWVAELRKIIADGAYDFIVPCDDRSILPIHRHLDRFGDAPFALPNEDAIRIFNDKFETRQLAQACGVPVAAGRLLTEGDTPAGLAGEFGFPLAIKPRRSYDIDNMGMRNNVRIARDTDALRDILAMDGVASSRLVEAWLPGHGVGVSVLADRGRVVQAFEYHRVHEPSSGGGSSYRVSKPLNPVLAAHVDKMVDGSKLDGVAMFEFRLDPGSGKAGLLEVNARFWGGLPLAIAAGVDFPWLLYRQSARKETVAATPYRIGYYARNIEADIYAVAATARELGRESRPRAIAYLLRTGISGALRSALFKEKSDTFSWSDMAPFKTECGRIIASIVAKLGRLAGLPPRRRARKSRAALRAVLERIGQRRQLQEQYRSLAPRHGWTPLL